MAHDGRIRLGDWNLWLAILAIVVGLAIAGFSLARLHAHEHLAQGTAPLQGTAAPDNDKDKPAESKPGGTRPTTPAPEPARPDPEAQKAGAAPALPPAPAEKVAPPIQQKQ